MSRWTKLYSRISESEHMSGVLDAEPEAFALFMLLMSQAGVWGRFPGNLKALKGRVAPLSDRLSAERIGELLEILATPPKGEKEGLIILYEHEGSKCVAIAKHFCYNPQHQWQNINQPEFPPPPGWEPPDELLLYLKRVKEGHYRSRDYEEECLRLGFPIGEPTKVGTAKEVEVKATPDPVVVDKPAPKRKLRKRAKTTVDADPPTPAPEPPAPVSPLHAALVTLYPNYRKRRLSRMLRAFEDMLAEPGCAISEEQLIESLRENPPLAGSTPEKYMLFLQGQYRNNGDEPSSPPLSQERLQQIEEEQQAEAVATLHNMRLRTLEKHGIPVETDNLWQAAQDLMRARDQWSVRLSLCWLKEIDGATATILVTSAGAHHNLDDEAIVDALSETTGITITEINFIETVSDHRTLNVADLVTTIEGTD